MLYVVGMLWGCGDCEGLIGRAASLRITLYELVIQGAHDNASII